MLFSHKHILLKHKISETLIPLIQGDYYLADCPFHSNIGDILIWQGELELLKECNGQLIGYSSLTTFDHPKISPETVILFHGGGNLGELYRQHIEHLFLLMRLYPKNRIIIFPQTFNYTSPEILKSDIQKLSSHTDLHICSRDKRGFDQLSRDLEHVYLVPDMAFYIPQSFFEYQPSKNNGSLFLKRLDDELADNSLAPHCDHVHDWPTFEHKIFDGIFIAKIINKLSSWNIPFFKNIWKWYAMNIYRTDLIRIGVKFIKRYDYIYSTRLHGIILSLLCQKRVTAIDNSYGKNLNFIKTWLDDVDELYLLS